ncbi:MAG: hypothetical protein OXF02_02140 [Simkaniaceae bacterium]|nr:hypothetical protein [Simkaniaceae bacterium]
MKNLTLILTTVSLSMANLGALHLMLRVSKEEVWGEIRKIR